jgi:hypothetical protein
MFQNTNNCYLLIVGHLQHNPSGDIVGMDIGLAIPEEGVTGTELRHNHEADSMDVDLGSIVQFYQQDAFS